MDDEEQVIVAADVSQNVTDHAEFKPLVGQVERNPGILPKESSADAGYSSYDNLEYAELKGLDVYMPDNFLEVLDEGEEGEKRYHKSNFRYDEVRDTYICPEAEERGREADLQEAWIYGGAGFRTEKVGWHSQFAREVWQADRRGYAGVQGKTIDFGRGRGVESTLRMNKSSRKEVVVFNE